MVTFLLIIFCLQLLVQSTTFICHETIDGAIISWQQHGIRLPHQIPFTLNSQYITFVKSKTKTKKKTSRYQFSPDTKTWESKHSSIDCETIGWKITEAYKDRDIRAIQIDTTFVKGVALTSTGGPKKKYASKIVSKAKIRPKQTKKASTKAEAMTRTIPTPNHVELTEGAESVLFTYTHGAPVTKRLDDSIDIDGTSYTLKKHRGEWVWEYETAAGMEYQETCEYVQREINEQFAHTGAVEIPGFTEQPPEVEREIHGPEAESVMTVKVGKSANAVEEEGGRLKKHLAPIEAILEWIGDVVYYEILTQMKTWEWIRMDELNPYEDILRGIDPWRDFQVDASTYFVTDKVIPKSMRKQEGGPDVTEKAEKSPQNPIQILLQYSRPYFNTIPFSRDLLTIDKFTVGNAVTIAIIAWLDALFMNNDRFLLIPKLQTHGNRNNMMLISIHEGAKYQYFPIDEGFGRLIYFAWFAKISKNRRGVGDLYPKKQLLYTEQGLAISDTKGTKLWIKWYSEEFLGDDNWMAKAEQFVENNLGYFPDKIPTVTEVAYKNFLTKISFIIKTVWKGIGADIIRQCYELVIQAFKCVNAPKSIPHVTSSMDRAQVALKQKEVITKASVKSKSKKKPKFSLMSRLRKSKKISQLKFIQKQWAKVQVTMKKVFKIAKDFEKQYFTGDRILYFNNIMQDFDVLVQDFDEKRKPGAVLDEAKERQYRDTISSAVDAIERDRTFSVIGEHLQVYESAGIDEYLHHKAIEGRPKGKIVREIATPAHIGDYDEYQQNDYQQQKKMYNEQIEYEDDFPEMRDMLTEMYIEGYEAGLKSAKRHNRMKKY